MASEQPGTRRAIVVHGESGRSGIGRLLMGSVATAVLKDATVPVILVHQPHAKA